MFAGLDRPKSASPPRPRADSVAHMPTVTNDPLLKIAAQPVAASPAKKKAKKKVAAKKASKPKAKSRKLKKKK